MMLNKVCSLARALALVVAVIAGFVSLGGLDTGLVLVVLGLIAGICVPAERLVSAAIAVLALPAVGVALGKIPAIGEGLTAITGNLALAAAGAVAMGIALHVFNAVKSDAMGLAGKS